MAVLDADHPASNLSGSQNGLDRSGHRRCRLARADNEDAIEFRELKPRIARMEHAAP